MFKKLSILFIFCLLFCSVAYAEDNPRLLGFPPSKIMGFKGLDTSSNAPMLDDGRATDMLNVKISSSFGIMKRYGYSVINDTLDDLDIDSPAITGIFDAEYSGTTSYTYAFVGSKLKYDTGTAWSAVSGTATITTGQNYQWVCAMALDSAVCTNNQDAPIKISSTPTKSVLSFGVLAAPPTKAKAVIWFRNYLIFGNTYEGSDKPTRFRWSNVGTIETFSEIDYDDSASLNGDEIIAFKEMYAELYIIMRKSIWKASLVGGDDIFVYSKLVDGIGAIAKESVQLVTFPGNKQGIIFLGEDKRVYLFNGITVTDIGERIQPTLDSLSSSRIQYAASAFDGENYILSATTSSGSYNDKIYLYNIFINEWSVYDGYNANAFARVKESTSDVKTYFGNYDAFVYWFDDSSYVDDVVGFSGIVDSVGTVNTATQTGATMWLDSAVDTGLYTGAVIRITSGTGAGEDSVVLTRTDTGIVVTTPTSTTPDTTSSYTLGAINSYFNTKWYDMNDASRQKLFRMLYVWAKEDTGDDVTVSYAEDYGATLGSETLDLSPDVGSLWDSAIWDESVWGTTGDKFYTSILRGQGRVIQLKFSQNTIGKSFHIYGFHLLADALDRQ